MSIGEKISPILNEIEDSLWEFESTVGTKTEYTREGFRSGVKIFMSVIMDKCWELQESEKMKMEDREKMAEQCGKDIRNLIKTYTNIDTMDLYKEL